MIKVIISLLVLISANNSIIAMERMIDKNSTDMVGYKKKPKCFYCLECSKTFDPTQEGYTAAIVHGYRHAGDFQNEEFPEPPLHIPKKFVEQYNLMTVGQKQTAFAPNKRTVFRTSTITWLKCPIVDCQQKNYFKNEILLEQHIMVQHKDEIISSAKNLNITENEVINQIMHEYGKK